MAGKGDEDGLGGVRGLFSKRIHDGNSEDGTCLGGAGDDDGAWEE